MFIKVRKDLEMRTRRSEQAQEVFSVIDSNRAHLRTYLPWVDTTVSAEQIAETLKTWEREEKDGTDIVLGIFMNNKYIGNIGIHDINVKRKSSAMIGYWLAEDYQGQGIMTDCVRALTNYCFTELKLNKVYIHCAADNTKSRAVPQRLGYAEEGILKDGESLYGVFHDLVIYGIVRRDWKGFPDESMRNH